MELWADAQKSLINSQEIADVDLELTIIENAKIPIILTENDSILKMANVDEAIMNDKNKLSSFLNNLKNQNNPIDIEYAPNKFQKLHYGDSALLNKLKYYPIALLLIIVLFSGLVYYFYQSTKISTQNKLWAGMAKETAHQIGTPLSSLIGWVEILKTDNTDPSTTSEIEKDIHRLQTITDRFSKIGSIPILEKKDIVFETFQTYNYLKSRFSTQINFSFEAPDTPVFVMLNPILHGWTIENLIKNAIDAMKGKGSVAIKIIDDNENVKINVTDNGSGIQKKQFKTVFEPGYTTKKRGWGLGLSLTKRIVKEYHKGSIKVLTSEIGIGTTMQIVLKKTDQTLIT